MLSKLFLKKIIFQDFVPKIRTFQDHVEKPIIFQDFSGLYEPWLTWSMVSRMDQYWELHSSIFL